MQNTEIHFKVYNVEILMLILAVRRVTNEFYKVNLTGITAT